MPDLRESYSSKETKPFGAYTAFGILQNSFKDNYVQKIKFPFTKGMGYNNDTSSLYCCISRNFFIEEQDVEYILDYVYRGNTFFLSAANIDSLLMTKIFCKVQGETWPSRLRETDIRLIGIANIPKDNFSYYYFPFASHFSTINDNYSRVVGYNSNEQPNCIVFFWGKGKMFLHTDPRAFSNYFLLKRNNYLYMQQLLQLMNGAPQHVYWDDYYFRQHYKDSRGSFSTFSEIMKYPPLAMALWLCLALLLLYILFGGKRRQRIVKQRATNQNSSVAFTETIARLYLQKKDNKNIAEKMITFFNEYIRTHYFLYANAGSDDFIHTLSRKSGVSLEKTTSLYHAIDHATKNEEIDDYQLLSLNEQIQQFYKKRK
jgi:hypothetical protein